MYKSEITLWSKQCQSIEATGQEVTYIFSFLKKLQSIWTLECTAGQAASMKEEVEVNVSGQCLHQDGESE